MRLSSSLALHLRKLARARTIALLCGGIIVAIFLVAAYTHGGFPYSLMQKKVRIVVPIALESSVGADTFRKMSFALEEAGGKAGRYSVELMPVDLSYLSDAGKLEDVDRLNTFVRTLSDERIVGVLGPITTDAALLTTPLINAAGLAQISYTTSYPGFTVPNFADPQEHFRLFPTGIQTFFTLVPHTLDMARAVGKHLATMDARSIFLVDDATTYAKTANRLLYSALAGSQTMVLGSSTVPSDTSPENIAIIEQIADAIIASQAQVVFLTSYPHDAYFAFINTLFGRGFTGTLLGHNMQRNHVPSKIIPKDRIVSINFTPSIMWIKDASVQAFIQRYRERYPQNTSDFFSIFTPYDAVNIMLNAIAKSDGTREGVLNVLATQKNTGTLYGLVSFDQNGYRTKNVLEVSELVGGEFVFRKYIEP